MTSVADETKVGSFPKVIRIDEAELRGHVDQVVRQSVEETLNGLLEAEADALCGADRYERNPDPACR
jgi:transposase-like protein